MAKRAATKSGKSGGRGAYISEESLEEFGTVNIKLRQWRWFRGRMTVAELAAKADLSDGTITQIENNKSGFSAATLAKLAKALDITTGMLLDVNPLDSKEFWPLFEQATKAQREAIAEHAAVILRKR